MLQVKPLMGLIQKNNLGVGPCEYSEPSMSWGGLGRDPKKRFKLFKATESA